MRQNVIRLSALLAVFVAACSEPTGTNQSLATSATPRLATTIDGGQLNIVSGNNLIATSGGFMSTDASVQVLDPAGNPVSGASVTFTTVTLTGATRSRVGAGATCSAGALGTSFTATTGSNGIAAARWCTLGVGGQQMTASYGGASVTFNGIATTNGGLPTITKVQGDGTGNNNATMGGQIVPRNPTVVVTDNGSTATLSGVQLTFTAQGDGKVSGGTCANCNGAVVTTDAVGQASVIWRLRTTAGATTLTVSNPSFTAGGNPVPNTVFTVTALAVGTTATCVAGCSDNARDAVGTQFGPKDPAAQFTTSTGAVVGAGVAVTVTYGTGTNACGQTLNADNTLAQGIFTNASGIVAVPWCVATAAITTRTITFSAGDVSVTISGSETADFNTNNGTLTIDSGTGFTCTVNGVATPDFAVTYADAQGAKVSGATITFTATDNGRLANGTQSGAVISVTTNSAGQASARYTCANTSGSQTVTATSSTNAQANITGTATAGAAASITKIGGDNQTATAGTATARNPTVAIRDANGNLVDGVNVTFTPTGPSGAPATIAGRGSVTGINNCGDTGTATGSGCRSVVSGSQGTTGNAATVWTLSTTIGTNTLTAASSVGTVTFTATGN